MFNHSYSAFTYKIIPFTGRIIMFTDFLCFSAIKLNTIVRKMQRKNNSVVFNLKTNIVYINCTLELVKERRIAERY